MNAQGKILAVDLDGTLFYPKKRIRMLSTRNKSFLRRFIDEGGKVLLISGRNRFYIPKVEKKLKRHVDYAGCNGSFLNVNDQMINETFIDNNKLKEFFNSIPKEYMHQGYLLMCRDYSFIVPTKSFGWFNRFGFCIYQIDQGVYCEDIIKSDKLLHKQLEEGKIYKAMFYYGFTNKGKEHCYEASKYFAEHFPDFDFAYINQCIEITAKGVNKANAIKQYLDYLKASRDNVIVVGDSGNDVSMFKEFPNSFCMSHASNDVKATASHIIDNVYDIEKYL